MGLAMWIYSIDKKQWRTMKHNVGPISRRAHAVTNLSDSVTLLFGGNPGIEEYQERDFALLGENAHPYQENYSVL